MTTKPLRLAGDRRVRAVQVKDLPVHGDPRGGIIDIGNCPEVQPLPPATPSPAWSGKPLQS